MKKEEIHTFFSDGFIEIHESGMKSEDEVELLFFKKGDKLSVEHQKD